MTNSNDSAPKVTPQASVDPAVDPDGDPANLNPRDTRDKESYEGDPDADPGNLNPRATEEG